MRSLLTIFFFCLLATGQGQKPVFKYLKRQIAPASCMFLAGMADGINQVIQFRYPAFKKAFPNLHADWWNPKISGANKYAGGKKENGAKFPGSTTYAVGVTDAFHCFRGLEHLFMSGAVSLNIGQKRQKWYIYVIQVAAYWLINRASFSLTYNSFK